MAIFKLTNDRRSRFGEAAGRLEKENFTLFTLAGWLAGGFPVQWAIIIAKGGFKQMPNR